MSDNSDSENTYRSRYTRSMRQNNIQRHPNAQSRAFRPPNTEDFRRRYSGGSDYGSSYRANSYNQGQGRSTHSMRGSPYPRPDGLSGPRRSNVPQYDYPASNNDYSPHGSSEEESMEDAASTYSHRNEHFRPSSVVRSIAPSSAISHITGSRTAAHSYVDPHALSQGRIFMNSKDILGEDADEIQEKGSEFVLRYTPVECKADQFAQNYLLRTMENERRIKVFIVVTMYNEDADELRRTLKGVLRNIDTFIEREGEDAWKEICLCIVCDGRDRANKGTLDFLERLGLFDAEEMHAALDKHVDVKMHLFETTLMVEGNEINTINEPLQAMFALKEHGGGKLDSHHWFFNAFGAQLQPKYCFMVDVGTKPEQTAIYKLYECMETDPDVAGCCGEITTRMRASLTPWVAAQQFEYKIATILDKSMESVFGFISVLPGAFSAYRYAAIDGEPLQQYFKQIHTDVRKISPFKGNMYLAEDRILCFEVLAEKGHQWKLKYVKGSTAATDVPIQLTDLIKQRRRWLNGSLFAMIYAIGNFRKFLKHSNHSRLRKAFISMQFGFYTMQIVLTWFLLATFYLTFQFATNLTSEEANDGSAFIVQVFRAMFLILTLVQTVAGLGNRPDEMAMIYFLCVVGYGVFFMYTLGLTAQGLFGSIVQEENETLDAFNQRVQENTQATIAALGSVAVYFGAGLLHGELFSVIVSIVQYFFMLPTFLIGFPIYSFCNVHDISWGTKGIEASGVARNATRQEKELVADQIAKRELEIKEADSRFRAFRSNLVIGWISSNVIFYYFVQRFGGDGSTYILWIFYVILFFNVFKFFFCLIYILKEWMTSCKCPCRRRQKQ